MPGPILSIIIIIAFQCYTLTLQQHNVLLYITTVLSTSFPVSLGTRLMFCSVHFVPCLLHFSFVDHDNIFNSNTQKAAILENTVLVAGKTAHLVLPVKLALP
jgi:hypothetical protein